MDPEVDRLIERMRAEGRTSATLVRVTLWVDWAAIAIDHRNACGRARERLVEAIRNRRVDAFEAQKAEFRSGLITVTAASHSVDAFYAAVASYVPLPAGTRETWERNRTRRVSRIWETLKCGFQLAAPTEDELRWLFESRDTAVHFREEDRDPVAHPVIPANAAPEDLTFSWESAQRSVTLLKSLLVGCTSSRRSGKRYEALARRVRAMRPQAESLIATADDGQWASE